MIRKRYVVVLAALILCACLSAVYLRNWQPTYPERAADGADWDENWLMLGSALGAEPPRNGFRLLDNNTVLAADDAYLATWASGEPTPYVNEDGDDVDLYEAQIYLLLLGCRDAQAAEDAVAEWIGRESDTYAVRERRQEAHSAAAYDVLLYDCQSDANPYSRGASAFATWGNYAVSAEVTCTAGYIGDEAALLAEFLDGLHYNAAIEP